MTQALDHFQDKVREVIEDWRGQDEMFFHDRAMRTIYWYCGKIRTLECILSTADIRTRKKQFIEAVANEYGMDGRRLYEARAVYKRFYKPADSLKETCERIFQETGSWSKALPVKKEMAEFEPPKCKKCEIHCSRR